MYRCFAGCDAYINGNLGSGSPQEMAEWVEYLTFDGVSPMAELRAKNGRKDPWRVKYFGIGNENWGCGGNMLPEYYGGEEVNLTIPPCSVIYVVVK